MKKRIVISYLKLFFLTGVPIVLLCLPANFFDNGQSLCISKLLFSMECYACGLTRACMHLIHFEFEEAFAYNMGSFISFPVLATYWGVLFYKEVKTFSRLRKNFS